jgi:hypothetical protein
MAVFIERSVMTSKLLLAAGVIVFSVCAAAQDRPETQPKSDDNAAAAKEQDKKPAAKREDQTASAGASTSPQAGPYGEQPPAVSPAGSSSERTAEPEGKDKHDAPTGEKTQQ